LQVLTSRKDEIYGNAKAGEVLHRPDQLIQTIGKIGEPIGGKRLRPDELGDRQDHDQTVERPFWPVPNEFSDESFPADFPRCLGKKRTLQF
jgi:hypothetical protein